MAWADQQEAEQAAGVAGSVRSVSISLVVRTPNMGIGGTLLESDVARENLRIAMGFAY